jgi:excinuclease UvrABC nuclease subunit
MPFAECAARSFTVVSIQNNAPEASGVYGLCNSREWLFVGESNNIRAHLLQHAKEGGTALRAKNPTGFTFEICSPAERLHRLDVLVRELEPRLNRRAD